MAGGTLQKLAALIEIRGRSEGVDEVAAGLREVADAGAPAADAIGRTERATAEAGRAASTVDDKYRALGAGLREAAAAGAPLARVIEKTTVETNSAGRAAAKLEQRYDKVLALEARRERELAQLNRVVAAGTKLAEREDVIRQKINQTFDRQIEKVRAAERAQDALNDQAQRGAGQFDRLGRSAGAAGREVGLLGRVAGSLRGVFGAALAGISFAAITAGAKAAIADIDEIAKKARALGGIEQAGFLQESRFAFGQLGFDDGQGDKLLGDFQRRVGEFRVGSGELGQIALKIEGGAEFARALKDAGSLEKQFDVALKKLSEIEDAAQRAALAGKLFGEEAGKNIGALAEAGVEGFSRLRVEARAAGLVIEEDVLVRAEVMNDRLAKASQIVGVNLKTAFAEIGPVIVGLVELTARLIKGAANGLRELRTGFADFPTGAGAAPESPIVKAEQQLAAAERELARRRDGIAIGRETLAGLFLNFEEEQAKVDALRAKISDLRFEIDNLRGAGDVALDGFGDAAGAVSDARQQAIDKRVALEARLKAAQGGATALAAFDLDAQVKAAAAAAGFSGDESATFEKETRAALELEAAIAKVSAGYKAAGAAAGESAKIAEEFSAAARRLEEIDAGARARPVVDLGDVERRRALAEDIAAIEQDANAAARAADRERLTAAEKRLGFAEKLIGIEESIAELEGDLAIAGLPEREFERATRRRDIEREIASLRRDAANAGAEFDEASTRNALAREQALKDAIDLERRAAEQADGVARQLEDSLVAAGDNFWDKFVRTGKFEIKDLARDFKTAFLEFAIAPLRQLTANLFGSIGAGFAGGNPAGSIFTPGFAGPGAFNLFGGGGFGAVGPGGRIAGTGLSIPGAGPAGLSFTNFGSLAAGFGGLALGGAAGTTFGLASLIGPANLGKFAANFGNFIGLAGGVTDVFGEALAGAGTFGGALGGIGGSLLSGAIFGNSKAQSIGSTVGGIGGNLIPVPFLGPLIGSFIGGAIGSLFASKPSNKVGSVTFDPGAGKTIGEASKDRSADALRNLDTARAIEAGITGATQALVEATGGTIGGLNLFADAGNRNGIRVGQVTAGGLTGVQSFENNEAGAQQAIEAGIRIALKALDTPFSSLDKFIAANVDNKPVDELAGDIEKLAALFKGIEELDDKAQSAVDGFAAKMIEAGRPVDDIIEKSQKLAAVYESTREPVDQFAQRARDVNEAIAPLIADFKELGQATQDLEKIQREALDRVGKDRNDLSRQQLLGVVNPLLAQVEAQAKAFAAERKGAEEAKNLGAPVDLALLAAAQRAQVLAPFNLEARAAALTDPASAQLRAVADAQIRELEALGAAIAAGLATQEDLFRLQTVQAGDRAATLKALPQEDQLRLAGSPEFEAFSNISGRIGIHLTAIVSEFDRFEAGLENFRSALAEEVSAGKALVADFDRALLFFAGRGTPGSQLKDLRATFTDLVERAVGGDRTARENLVEVGTRLRDKTLSDNASSIAGQADLNLVEAGIARVRAVVAGEVSDAERQLSVLEESRDIQRQMRDLLAAQDFDPVRFEKLAAGLPDSDPLRGLALELVALKAQQSGIAGRAADLIAGTDPEALFARLLAPANDAAAPAAAIAGGAPSISLAAGDYRPLLAPANDAPIPFLAASALPASAPSGPALASPANASALDDDIVAELATIADRLGEILAVLRGQRGDHVKQTDKLSGQLGQLASNQVRRSL